MAQYDLTPVLSQFFDRHLVIPLLEFLSQRQIYDESEMYYTRLEILGQTKMFDYMIEELKLRGDPVSDDLMMKREAVIQDLKASSQKVTEITNFLAKEDVKNIIENMTDSSETYEALLKIPGFDAQMVDDAYTYAKLKFDTGDYQTATQYLDFYRSIALPNHPRQRDAKWGKLAGEILNQDWDTAIVDLVNLKEDIDNAVHAPLVQSLNDRAWLIHWSLYVFFNHQKGKDMLVEWCTQPEYLNAIQTLSPHILRYLVVAILTNRRKRTMIKDVVEIIKQEESSFRDPVTEFVESLFKNFDFDTAQHKLKECEMVLLNDFFLTGCLHEFIDSARQYIFENYCRIHSRISIPMLAEKLHLDAEEAEKWIANVIRNARLDARIDAAKGEVLMGTPAISSYQMLIEKTKTLSLRTQQMVNQVDKRIGGRSNTYHHQTNGYEEAKATHGY